MEALASITQGERLRSSGLGDARLHVVAHRPGRSMPRHSHQTGSLTLVLAGEFLDEAEGERRRCGAMTLILKPPGTEHATSVGAGGARSLVFEFAPEAMSALAPEVARTPRRRCCTSTALAARLIRLAAGDPDPNHVRATLAETMRAVAAESGPAGDPRLDRALTRLGDAESIREIAERAGMHPASFSRLFRRSTGTSPTRWRQRSMVARAAAELAAGRGSIAAVAAGCGFSDHAHLCRLFKRETGLTPSAYRSLVRD